MIVLVHAADEFGAVERYAEAIAAGLREGEEDAVLLHPEISALSPFAELAGGRLRVEMYPAAWLDEPSPIALIRIASRLRRLRPRVVHVLDVWPLAQVAGRLARPRRLLVTHHTPALPRRDSAAGRLWWRLGRLVAPETIYTSETDRRSDGGLHSSAHVIPLGIDLDRFDVRAQRGGSVIGTVARLAPQKGLTYLLDAVPRVLERRPDATFVIVGDGELRDELEQHAAALGVGDRVRWLGARDDVPELLASFDVFAFPSLFEGFCLAVVEAQAAGVPVVATPVGAISEHVVDGETGLLRAPRDAAALADGILRLLEDRDAAEAMAAEARRRVRVRYSVDRMVAETLALYARE